MSESDFTVKLAFLRQVQDRFHHEKNQPEFLAQKIRYDSDFTMTYSHESVIEVSQCDTLEAAKKLHDPLVLILADDVRPPNTIKHKLSLAY